MDILKGGRSMVKENPLFKKGMVFGIIILFTGIAVAPLSGSTALPQHVSSYNKPSSMLIISRGKILYVGGSGPNNYTEIQAAIDNASIGDTVFVYNDSSPYYENVKVNKSINLLGEDKNTTIIDGSNNNDNVISISEDNVQIREFLIRNSGTTSMYSGIWIKANDAIMDSNIITSNEAGINTKHSNNTIISNNYFSNNWCGILQEYSNNSTIIQNICLNNTYGVNNVKSNNSIVSFNNISNDYIGISIYDNSNYNILKNNKINSNGDTGIEVMDYSTNNIIIANNITFNYIAGIHFYQSSNNTVKGNKIVSNHDGISLTYSKINTILDNTITSNNNGILLRSHSTNNSIYHNNFINNNQNAYDECDNIWDDGKKGNYWSDYEEKYPNAHKLWWKGIWDTPYVISGNNKDICPLIKQWSGSDLLSKTMPDNQRNSQQSSTSPAIQIQNSQLLQIMVKTNK
jgi:nitrous oxidase accessory protein